MEGYISPCGYGTTVKQPASKHKGSSLVTLERILIPIRALLFLAGLGSFRIRNRLFKALYILYQTSLLLLVWFVYATRLLTYVKSNDFYFDDFHSDKAVLIAVLLWVVQEIACIVGGIYMSVRGKHEELPILWQNANGNSLVAGRAWHYIFILCLGFLMTIVGTAIEIVFPYPVEQPDPLTIIGEKSEVELGKALNYLLSVMFNIWWWIPLTEIGVVATAVSSALLGFREQVAQSDGLFERPSMMTAMLKQHAAILQLIEWLELCYSFLVAITIATAIPTCIMLLYALLMYDASGMFRDYGLDFYHVVENVIMLVCVFMTSQIVTEHERLYLVLYHLLVEQLASPRQPPPAYDELPTVALENGANPPSFEDAKHALEIDNLLILGNSFQLLSKAPVGVTAYRFFLMRRETVLSIFAAIVTYLVVLMQISGQSTTHVCGHGAANKLNETGIF